MSVAAVASQYKRALSQVAGALAAKVTHTLHYRRALRAGIHLQ